MICPTCNYPHETEHCPNPACPANPALSDEVKARIAERHERHLAEVAEREERMRLWGRSISGKAGQT